MCDEIWNRVRNLVEVIKIPFEIKIPLIRFLLSQLAIIVADLNRARGQWKFILFNRVNRSRRSHSYRSCRNRR